MAVLFRGERCQSHRIYIPHFLHAELVSILIQRPASTRHGTEMVYVGERMRELFQKIPEKYGACCEKFRELTGRRETFQPGRKYGSLSKDLCHPEAIVCCSAQIPTGQSHLEFQQISLSSSHQDPAIGINTAVVFQEMWQRAARKKGTISVAKCQGTLASLCLGKFGFLESPLCNRGEPKPIPYQCHSRLSKLMVGIIPF